MTLSAVVRLHISYSTLHLSLQFKSFVKIPSIDIFKPLREKTKTLKEKFRISSYPHFTGVWEVFHLFGIMFTCFYGMLFLLRFRNGCFEYCFCLLWKFYEKSMLYFFFPHFIFFLFPILEFYCTFVPELEKR